METNDCAMGKNATEKKIKNGIKEKKAYGLIDRIINKMPEIHIPGYQYCGMGTDLKKRLMRGDPGINQLDAACKEHDIAYDTGHDSKDRRKADKKLISRAFKRVYSTDAKTNERAAALLVSGLLTAKVGLSKIGLGLGSRGGGNRRKRMRMLKRQMKKKKNKNKKTKSAIENRKSIPFEKLVKSARESIKKSESKSLNLNDTIQAAIRSAKDEKRRGKTVQMPPRVLKLPKFGGSILPILPILSGLSAIGSITSSTVGIVNAIKKLKMVRKQVEKEKNHHQHQQQQQQHITGQKIGRGLYLSYERRVKGYGFYLKPYHKG